MAEQLALDEVAWHGSAVEHDERALLAGRSGMDGTADQLFAGAGLAGDQHGELGAGHPVEHREDLAHGHGSADEVLEARLGGRDDVDDLVGGSELQVGLADAEAPLLTEVDLLDPDRADEGAVGRIEVAEQDAVLGAHDLGVIAADGAVGQPDVVALAAADADDVRLELVFPACLRTRDHAQVHAPQM